AVADLGAESGLVKTLQLISGPRPVVQIQTAAVGRQSGSITLNVNLANPTVSTVSADFMAAAAPAPGWEEQVWSKRGEVPLTTIGALMLSHGRAAFLKIAVQRFRAQGLAGLCEPVAALSFEFTLIQRDVAQLSIERCRALGYAQFNAALGESQTFEHDGWLDADDISRWLDGLPAQANSGDVYARLA